VKALYYTTVPCEYWSNVSWFGRKLYQYLETQGLDITDHTGHVHHSTSDSSKCPQRLPLNSLMVHVNWREELPPATAPQAQRMRLYCGQRYDLALLYSRTVLAVLNLLNSETIENPTTKVGDVM
jgi:hypothetical protein